MRSATLPRGRLAAAHVTLLLGRLDAAYYAPAGAARLVLSMGQYVTLLAVLLPEEFALPPGCDVSVTNGPPGTPRKAAALAARVAGRQRLWAKADADYVRDDRLGRESVCSKKPRRGGGSEVNHPQALGRSTKPGTVLLYTAAGLAKRPELCDNQGMITGKFRWSVTLPGAGLDVLASARTVLVTANTRGEARAAAKEALGVQGRLPERTRVEKLGPAAPLPPEAA